MSANPPGWITPPVLRVDQRGTPAYGSACYERRKKSSSRPARRREQGSIASERKRLISRHLMSKRRIILLSIPAVLAVIILACCVAVRAAEKRAESLRCASAITSICLAGRLWAEDNGGFMPSNFVCMSNEVNTPKILSCQSSRRARTSNWSDFTLENCTYEIVAPGMRAEETNKVFLLCTIHGHLGYSDSTVFDGVRRRHKYEQDK